MDREKIKRVYNTLSHPGGLGAVKRIKDACKLSNSQAKEFLKFE